MPKKAKGKKKKKKPAPRKAVKKAAKKKALRKKVTAKKKRAKKKVGKKKVAAKKKAVKKKAAKKAVKKKAAAKAKPARKRAVPSKPPMVTPGPPSGTIPPVEEPAPNEVAAGVVTHYYSHLGVAVIQVNKGEIKTGDTIHIKGHTTDFTQPVESMEYEHQHIDVASAGRSVGLKVKDHTREHDIVYLVK
jgi:putative protease